MPLDFEKLDKVAYGETKTKKLDFEVLDRATYGEEEELDWMERIRRMLGIPEFRLKEKPPLVEAVKNLFGISPAEAVPQFAGIQPAEALTTRVAPPVLPGFVEPILRAPTKEEFEMGPFGPPKMRTAVEEPPFVPPIMRAPEPGEMEDVYPSGKLPGLKEPHAKPLFEDLNKKIQAELAKKSEDTAINAIKDVLGFVYNIPGFIGSIAPATMDVLAQTRTPLETTEAIVKPLGKMAEETIVDPLADLAWLAYYQTNPLEFEGEEEKYKEKIEKLQKSPAAPVLAAVIGKGVFHQLKGIPKTKFATKLNQTTDYLKAKVKPMEDVLQSKPVRRIFGKKELALRKELKKRGVTEELAVGKAEMSKATKKAEQVIRNMTRRKYQRLAQADYSNEGIELFDENQFARDLGVKPADLERVLNVKRHEPIFGGKGVMWRPTDQEVRAAIPKLEEYLRKSEQPPIAPAKPVTEKPIVEAPKPAPAVKEPWEMTRGEYRKQFQKAPWRMMGRGMEASVQKHFRDLELAPKRHKRFVQEALHEGKPVPENVLAEYPELAGEPVYLTWGKDQPHYLKKIVKSKLRYFFREAKEVARIDLPYKHKQTVYYYRGKLVRLSNEEGVGNISALHEVIPEEHGNLFNWKQTKLAREIAPRFGAKITEEPTAGFEQKAQWAQATGLRGMPKKTKQVISQPKPAIPTEEKLTSAQIDILESKRSELIDKQTKWQTEVTKAEAQRAKSPDKYYFNITKRMKESQTKVRKLQKQIDQIDVHLGRVTQEGKVGLDESIRTLTKEVEGNVKAKEEGGFLRIGAEKKPVAPIPKMEKVLTATRSPLTLPYYIAQSFKTAFRRIKEEFTFEGVIKKGYPELANQMRLFKGAPYDALKKSYQMINASLGDLNRRQYEIFKRISILEDLRETAASGKKTPGNFSAEQWTAELNRVRALADKQTLRAVERSTELLQQAGEELVRRGKLSPEAVRSHWFHHEVIDYANDFGNTMPWLPRRLRSPFRQYTKERIGSTREIDTDWIGVTERVLSRIFLDNAIDDQMGIIAERYNLMPKFDKASMSKIKGMNIGQLVPDNLLPESLKGKKIKIWQYDPGNRLYPARTINESILNRAIEENMTVNEWLAEVGVRGGESVSEAAALGRHKPIYLLEESIAKRLTFFKQPRIPYKTFYVLRNAITLWKRITLGPFGAGIPFQLGNFVGDTINLYKTDPAAILKYWESTKALAGKGEYRAILKLAEEQRITEGLYGTEIPVSRIPGRLARLRGIRGMFRKYNPLALWDTLSWYREAIGRMAKFMKDVERINKGERVKAGEIDIRGLKPMEAAGKVAREFTVDYGKTSPAFEQQIRQLCFPFATFWIHNAKNWARYVTKRPGNALLKFGVPYGAMQLWNNLKFPEVEKNLPEYYRLLPHIVTGWETDDGRPIIIALQTPMDMAMKAFGFDKVIDNSLKVVRGEMKPKEAIVESFKDVTMAFPDMAKQLWEPYSKSFIEVLANKDSFTGRKIVPDRLKGTPQAMQLKVRHFLEGVVTPFAQYMRGTRKLEPGESLKKYLGYGPFDIPRAVGVKKPSLKTEKMRRKWESREKLESLRSSALDKIEKKYIQAKVQDETYMPFVNSVRRELKEKHGIVLSKEEIVNRLQSTRVKINIIKSKLMKETDPAVRKQLEKRLKLLQKFWMKESEKRLPKSIRSSYQREQK